MGAPIGNHNAQKHSSLDPGAQIRAALDLNTEISGLRFFYNRLVESSLSLTDPADIAVIVRTLTLASVGITRLVRAQLIITPPEVMDLSAEIGRVAARTRRIMGVREIDDDPSWDTDAEDLDDDLVTPAWPDSPASVSPDPQSSPPPASQIPPGPQPHLPLEVPEAGSTPRPACARLGACSIQPPADPPGTCSRLENCCARLPFPRRPPRPVDPSALMDLFRPSSGILPLAQGP